MTWLLLIPAVFASSAFYDWCSVRYHVAREEYRAADAATWGSLLVLIVVFNLGAFISYSMWLGLPEAAGAWLGTFVAVRQAAKR